MVHTRWWQNLVFTFSFPLLLFFPSATQSYLTLCDTMHYSKPGFFVHHHLPEPAQTHVHWVKDVIQQSCPLSSPYSLVFSLSQHQALFQWVSSLHRVTKVLELHFSISHSNDIQDWFPLGLTGLISLHSKGLSKVFSNTTVLSIMHLSFIYVVFISNSFLFLLLNSIASSLRMYHSLLIQFPVEGHLVHFPFGVVKIQLL